MVNNNIPTAFQHFYCVFGILNCRLHKLPSVIHHSQRPKSTPMTYRGPVSIHGLETTDAPAPSLTFTMQKIAARVRTWKHPEHLINNTYQSSAREIRAGLQTRMPSRLRQHQVWWMPGRTRRTLEHGGTSGGAWEGAMKRGMVCWAHRAALLVRISDPLSARGLCSMWESSQEGC